MTTLLDLSHPGVFRHHQVVEGEGLIYVVTDRHDKTLEYLLTEHKQRKIPIPIAMILSVMKQLAAALAYLHGVNGANTRGLVHRDLRPANIFISADGEHFIIAGLGLCRNALRNENTIPIKEPYMAPEALLHNEASPASDVWSLGVILYEMATLRRPDFLEGKDPVEIFVDEWRPDLSGITDGFIKSVLERIFVLDPERRPTARELHETFATADIPVGELGGQCVMLRYRCGSLKTALNGASARIALLEEDVKTKSTRSMHLKSKVRSI
ncbi:Serine/threonine protein kinase [Giardia duodenalis]|uniref:non-specific serine/threonine protein kinase n=1 Tax=Giardia intestinalis TaxID=5741 RepID=V6T785_GIAIN|nr:Serine/threonine protein kinase [Giardia intestinalis]